MTRTGIAQLRDLRWAILSPDLINHPCYSPDTHWYQAFYRQITPAINRLQLTPDLVTQTLGPCRNLGVYFERLWLMAIDSHPDYALLAHDWQIQGEGRTLGALDILVRDLSSGTLEHWELCVKFYLGHSTGSGCETAMSQWLGINARDSLDRKFHKLFDGQLPLSDKEAVQAELEHRRWGKIDRKRSIFKGRLFYPHDRPLQAPPEVAANHLRGHWTRLAQQRRLPEWQQADWRPLPRLDWLADHPLASLPALSLPVTEPGRLCRLAPEGQHEHWALVDDQWPNRHP